MSVIDFIFFFYIFVALYMLSLFAFIYFPNMKKMFDYPKGKPAPVSIVMPCYNEGEHVGKAIESLISMNYPKDMIEIIVVDDKSSDNSVEVIKKYVEKYPNVRLIVNKRNSGGAAEPTNLGVKAAKYEYIAVTDADSTPDKDALIKMIGFLQKDKRVGAVTCAVLAKSPKTFMQRLQQIEYFVISFNRKLLDLVDAVYVTPGPFALYRKKILLDVGLFDVKNMTQDIEIVWRMISHGYKARMCLSARVYSETPRRFKDWWRQRIRWNIGGTQSIIKHKKSIFKNGMLGFFIIPFFSFSLFLGIIGLGLFLYLLLRRILVSYLSTQYSVYASTTIFYFEELTFAPSVLNFFGAVLFILGLVFTIIALTVMSAREIRNKNVFNLMFYLIVYLSIYPFIMITALYKLIRGKYSW